jgi:hypothetical protein
MNASFPKSESNLSAVPTPRNTFEPFVSADAVACYVGIERRQVMQLTRAGKLPAYPIDPEAKRKAWRYKLSEVDAMISGSRKAVGELAAAFGSRDNSEHNAEKTYRLSRGSRGRGAELERAHGTRSTGAEDGGKEFAEVSRG